MARQLQVLLAGLLLAANAGCLVVAAGAAAAGGAAAGYAYFTAPEIEEYRLAVPDATAATKAALADLGYPVIKEEQTADGLKIESQTGEKKTILIVLTARAQKIPADGPITRISVRVATFGDDMVSGRILQQIHVRAPVMPVAAPVLVQETAPPARAGRLITPDMPKGSQGIVLVQSAEPPPAPEPAPAPTSVVPQPIQPIH